MTTTTESPRERRVRETLKRCKTDAQRETCERLHAADKMAYPERRQGRTVVAEFRRYCETRDAEKIGEGLYHFSICGAGGLNDIAHFDLRGFRAEYPHPALYLERLLFPELERSWRADPREDPEGYHSYYVYTDGMTAGEVCLAVVRIAEQMREELLRDWQERMNAAKLAAARELAAELGMKVVPE